MIRAKPINIVVLDGHALNPGDLRWERLAALGQLAVYPRTSDEQVIDRAREAQIVLTNKTVLTSETLERLPELRYVGVLATGYDVVDVAWAASRGIVVTNVPGYGVNSVAQMVFALLLELTNHVGAHSEAVRHGGWSKSPDWCFWDFPIIELSGLILGVVGYGSIGRRVVKLANAFGMKVVVTTRHMPRSDDSVQFMDLNALLSVSDVVTLHCPLTPSTRCLINAQSIALMKSGAFLINTARGALVEDSALADALNTGRIAGAALDVLTDEPPDPAHPLLHARHCIVTPHIAWASAAARERLLGLAIDNVEAFVSGRTLHVVTHDTKVLETS